MAARENQAKQLVGLVLAAPGLKLVRPAGAVARTRPLPLGDGQQRQLLLPDAIPAEPVNRFTPGGGGQPAARVRRHALGAPVIECLDEGVLHQLLGQTDVAEPHSQHGPDLGGLLPVDLLKLARTVHTGQSSS